MYLLADLYKILEFRVPDMSNWDSFVALLLLRYNQLHDGIIAQIRHQRHIHSFIVLRFSLPYCHDLHKINY